MTTSKMEDFVGVRQLIATVLRARLPKKPQDSLWDIYIDPEGCISKITEHDPTRPEATTIIPGIIDAAGRLVGPSLCHAHIHLDKCFLLQDDKYRDLKIIKGDFDEAISLTNQAKQRFEEDDLIRRGCRLITESNQSRVTSMRAFVEVDENVGMRCLGVALKLKEKFQSECYVQICAFAQLALFSGEDTCRHRRALLETAAESSDVEVISSTPYVENSSEMMQKNCLWTIEVAIAYGKHLDFHLDYNVDDQIDLMTPLVIRRLQNGWRSLETERTVSLSHCTKLTLLPVAALSAIYNDAADLPVTFVGLPTSDLYMMATPEESKSKSMSRVRGTLQVLEMIQSWGLNAVIAINNGKRNLSHNCSFVVCVVC